MTSFRQRDWLRAGVKIAIAGALAFGVYAGYRHYVQIRRDVASLIDGPGGRGGGIRTLMAKDTPAAFLRAERMLEEVLRIHGRNAFGMVALSDVETQLVGWGYTDRAERAEETRRKAASKGVSFAELFDGHALALLQQGRAAEAEAYARSLLQKYPAMPSVPRFHDLLGRAQRAQGKVADARASFRRAQEADWRQPRFIADYAETLLEDGDATAALATFERALQANGDHLRSLIGKARAQLALARQGRGDAAAPRALLDALLGRPAEELTPEFRARALAARAEARLLQKDDAGAAEDSAAALALAPRLATVLRARGLIDAAAGRSDAADELLAAVAADRWDPSTYLDGAAALEAKGDLAGAGKLLEAHAQALPPTSRYHLARAQLLTLANDPAGARAATAEAAALEPASAIVRRAEPSIRSR
jgi:Tfp pilus assembly protein PilF